MRTCDNSSDAAFFNNCNLQPSHKKAASIQLVEFRTVVIETGADNLVLKFARVPEEPGPVFPYSAKVTWSVLAREP